MHVQGFAALAQSQNSHPRASLEAVAITMELFDLTTNYFKL